MFVNLRQNFLESQNVPETDIVAHILYRLRQMDTGAMMWTGSWDSLMGLILPNLNTVDVSGSDGEIRVNRVYSSDPSMLFRDLADFYRRVYFPKNQPWFLPFVRDAETKSRIDSRQINSATARYLDQGVNVVRDILSESDFYQAILEAILHDLVMGHGPVIPLVSQEGLTFVHRPVNDTPLLMARDKTVVGMALKDTFDLWELRAKYGDGVIGLLRGPGAVDVLKRPIPNHNAIPFTAAFPGTGTNGMNAGANQTDQFELRQLTVPNKTYIGIHDASRFAPEMEFISFIISEKTKRLIDVELHPVAPYGVSRGIRVKGERYSRGLGSFLISNVAVLNKKKKAELTMDGFQSNSPLVMKGRGFKTPPGRVEQGTILHLHNDTEMSRLYDDANALNRAHSIYAAELESLQKGVGAHRMNLEDTKRLSVEEFTTRQDTNWGFFQPTAERYFEQIARPLLRYVFNYAVVTGRIGQPPEDLASGKMIPEFDLGSSMTYGESSARGKQLIRALQPLVSLVERNPALLDDLNEGEFLRASLIDHELGEFVATPEQKEAKRRQRQEAIAAMNKGKMGPEEQAQQEAVRQEAAEQYSGERVIDAYAPVL